MIGEERMAEDLAEAVADHPPIGTQAGSSHLGPGAGRHGRGLRRPRGVNTRTEPGLPGQVRPYLPDLRHRPDRGGAGRRQGADRRRAGAGTRIVRAPRRTAQDQPHPSHPAGGLRAARAPWSPWPRTSWTPGSAALPRPSPFSFAPAPGAWRTGEARRLRDRRRRPGQGPPGAFCESEGPGGGAETPRILPGRSSATPSREAKADASVGTRCDFCGRGAASAS